MMFPRVPDHLKGPPPDDPRQAVKFYAERIRATQRITDWWMIRITLGILFLFIYTLWQTFAP